MASLRPGPGVIQRANSLQASDTSHTSTSTTDASTNTSVSHKPSPVSSIGESISSVVHKPTHISIPAARPARPLPVPPTLSPPLTSPGLTSTSTLKLTHQESHSTLGKSSASKPASSSTLSLTKSKSTPPRKLTRNRPDDSSVPQRAPLPPPSAFNSRRISEDNNWVSISILPAVSERQPDERFPPNVHEPAAEPASYAKPTAASTSKRNASASRTKSSPKSTARSNTAPKITPETAAKSLPRLPPLAQQAPQPQQDGAWEVGFRGVVRLVRWVSRRDTKDKRDPVTEDEGADEKRADEEKENLGARKGFPVSGEPRRSRDSYTQPMPKPGAPVGGQVRARPLSIVRPRPKLEGEKEERDGKRRLTKSNPGLVNFARPSVDVSPEVGSRIRTSTDAGLRTNTDGVRMNEVAIRTSADGRRTSSDIGLQMAPNGGGVFVPDVPLAVHPPRTSSLFPVVSQPTISTLESTSGARADQPDPPATSSLAYLQPEPFSAGPLVPFASDGALLSPASHSSLPYLQSPVSSAPGTQITTVTQTTQTTQTSTQTTTTQTTYTTQSSPLSQTATLAATQTQTSSLGTTQTQSALGFTYSPYSGYSVLSPVLEVPLFSSELVASPPEIGAAGEFPWAGMQVGEVVPSGSMFRTGVDGAVIGQVDTVVTEVLGNAPIGAGDSFSPGNSLSPKSGSSLSPMISNSASPSSGSLSPLSNSVSPLMSNVASTSASPVMPSNARLSDPYTVSHTAASSLSYATARSGRNIISAQAVFEAKTAESVQIVDPLMFDQPSEAAYLRSGAATDIGHGYSTRATSPTPSDRYAFSDDVHEHRSRGGILRALSSIDHSSGPLPLPRRPFLPSRGSSGSVTFDDSSAQSSPRLGARRKMMTMSASDVGHGDRFSAALSANHYGYGRSKPEVQRSKSSLSLAGRIIRKLSIGSNSGARGRESGQESETDRPKMTRKLTRRKSPTAASSTASLPFDDDPTVVPPVPPLPPGVVPGRYVRTSSEVGHGQSEIGHGQSEVGHASANGHARGESFSGYSAWGGSTSVLTHETSESQTIISPAPTRVSFGTQSAPPNLAGGRKLVKKRVTKRVEVRLPHEKSGQTLASVNYQSSPVSREPPRITTEFVQTPLLSDDQRLSAGATTEDGHLMPPRPGMPRRTSSQRRWTIADMDDDEFLRQLEAKLSGSGSRLRKSRVLEEFAMGADQGHEDIEDPGSDTDDSAAEREWVKARRAMMCVREIVRTEKSYLRHILGFSNGDDATSSILLEHLPRLVETSRMFTARLEEDPSAWGVSVAFLAVEEELEAALVEWSGVVGRVISSMHTRGESQATSEDGHTSSAGSGGGGTSWIRRRSATASSTSQPFQLNLTMTPVIGSSKEKKSSRITKSKRLTEQDVAIMPTQRVLRYVLMYRELLLHTPAKSASRPLVERALQGATRIARRCDEAQTHVDILSPS